ncbi:unnamed protein product [Coffea canephora]|uniref:Uncharacterized protein n=1 Tax=Coffea canephora TaxID=49390 RepID=A0A068VBI8_COFCA|nr:unnamed protein product [Coffea canephora]
MLVYFLHDSEKLPYEAEEIRGARSFFTMSCGWTNFCCELPPRSGTQRVEGCIQVQAHCVLLYK